MAIADPDGADRDDEINHERRDAKLVENFDGSWTLTGQFGSLQGAALHERFEQFVRAELEADWAWARERYGPDATADQLPRTTQQRRADAFAAMAMWAASVPADGRTPDPMVNIVVDQETFEDELRRACGEARCDRLSGGERHHRCRPVTADRRVAVDERDRQAPRLPGPVLIGRCPRSRRDPARPSDGQ